MKPKDCSKELNKKKYKGKVLNVQLMNRDLKNRLVQFLVDAIKK